MDIARTWSAEQLEKAGIEPLSEADITEKVRSVWRDLENGKIEEHWDVIQEIPVCRQHRPRPYQEHDDCDRQIPTEREKPPRNKSRKPSPETANHSTRRRHGIAGEVVREQTQGIAVVWRTNQVD
jgi:hypothetical protein